MFTSSLPPAFNKGLTFASLHTLGNLPDVTLLLTMNKRLIIFVEILRILGPILSDLVDLLAFRFYKNGFFFLFFFFFDSV